MNKPVWLVLLGVVGGLFGAGVIYLIAQPPRGDVITLLPPPTLPPLVVFVSGAVVEPGVFDLPPGSRVADAIKAAGGMTAQADPQALNLAQVVTDGVRIHVPDLAEASTETLPENPARSAPSLDILININTATQEELEMLPDIGPHIAQEIITYREANGPFQSIDEIMNVPGVGTITYNTIRDLITVTDQP